MGKRDGAGDQDHCLVHGGNVPPLHQASTPYPLGLKPAKNRPLRSVSILLGRYILRKVGGIGAYEIAFRPDDQGEMTLDPMPAGRWRLVSRLGIMDRRLDLRSATFDVQVAGHTTHTVVMAKHGSISLDWNAGTPPPGYAVIVIKAEGSTKSPTQMQADRFTRGSILIAYVPSGSYQVRVVARGVVGEAFSVQVGPDTTMHVPLRPAR